MTASAEDWGAHDLDRRFELGPAARRADRASRRRSTACSRGSPRRAATSSASRARWHTSCAPRWPGCAARRAGAGRATGATPTTSARRRCARSSRTPRAWTARSTRCSRSPATRSTRRRASVDLAALARELEDVEVTAPARTPAAEGDPDDRAPRARAARRERPPSRPRARVARAVGRGRPRPRSPSATTAPASTPRSASARSTPARAAKAPARRRARAPAGAAPGAVVRRRRRRRRRAPAAASCSQPAALDRRAAASGARSGVARHPARHEHHAITARPRRVARAPDAQQGPRGHPLLLAHQDHVHDGRRDRRRLPERQPRLRADEHDLSSPARCSRCCCVVQFRAAPLRARRLLVGRGRDHACSAR